jgi:ATP diphosphatase
VSDVSELLEIMRRLRDPDGGCPWDLEQTPRSILTHTLEEIHELADAIERDDPAAVRDELGDLLFHIVFYVQMASEAGSFAFSDVVAGIVDKLRRRHPHVFDDATVSSAGEQAAVWERLKLEERASSPATAGGSLLAGIPSSFPALLRAKKLQKRAAAVGFDWPELKPVIAKLEEEIGEFRAALAAGARREELEAELGDILFAVVNVARHAGVDAEAALRAGNRKFEQRFSRIEAALAESGRTPAEASLEEMESLWQAAKESGTKS